MFFFVAQVLNNWNHYKSATTKCCGLFGEGIATLNCDEVEVSEMLIQANGKQGQVFKYVNIVYP